MNFIAPKEESSYIKVIGVGGGGTNAVNHMYSQGITGVDFIVCNTDAKSLASSPVTNKIQLGEGLGAGGDPKVAEEYANEARDSIKEMLSTNTRMLFITAGMGGGTGTGASPVIAEVAKEIKTNDKFMPEVLVVAIVTMPFNWEGVARLEQAKEGLRMLREKVDSVIVVDNNKVFRGQGSKFSQRFAEANNVLLIAAKSISEVITVPSYMNLDMRDVNTVMAKSGTALMGSGIASGERRAIEAIEQAMESPLLDGINIADSQKILLHITYSEEYEITEDEIEEITTKITCTCNNSPMLKMGIGTDDTLGENLRVILVTTGFQNSTTGVVPPPTSVVNKNDIPHGGTKVEWNSPQKSEPRTVENTTAQTGEFTLQPKNDESKAQEPQHIQQQPTKQQIEDTRVVRHLSDVEEKTADEAHLQKTYEETPQIDPVFTVTSKTESVVAPTMQFEPASSEIQPQNEVQQAEPAQQQAQPETIVSFHSLEGGSEVQQTATQDLIHSRMADIKRMKEMMTTARGLAAVEGKAAYERQGMKIESAPDASDSEVEKKTIDKFGNITPNSFVYTDVD